MNAPITRPPSSETAPSEKSPVPQLKREDIPKLSKDLDDLLKDLGKCEVTDVKCLKDVERKHK